jgi:hypothetical protein
MSKEENINYNAFLESDDEDSNLKNGLKDDILKRKSRFSSNDKKIPSKVQFDESVKSSRVNDNSIIASIAGLTSRYKGYILDKTLTNNKNPLTKEEESETIKALCDVGLNLNEDQNQREGIGSIGLNSLLLKSVLTQRDKINELSYEIHNLKKILSSVVEALKEEE